MKTKRLLLALGLLTVTAPLAAQRSGASAGERPQVDSVITLTEDELVAGLRAIAASWQARQQTSSTQLNPELLRVLKLQMLLSSLGLGGEQQGLMPLHLQPQRAQRVDYGTVQTPVRDESRLSRLERLVELSLLQRQSQDQLAVLPLHQQRAARQSNDSLLHLLRSELAELRHERAKAAQQPQQQITQQPQQIIMPAIPLQPAQPIVQQPQTIIQPQQLNSGLLATYFKRQVFFAVGRSELLPEAKLTLNEVYRLLDQDGELRLFLTGFASPEGNARQNARLSEQRSRAVLDYLISCGVAPERLVAVSGGVDRNTDLYGVARRVDIELKK